MKKIIGLLSAVFLLLANSSQIKAGTDLIVSCNSLDSCQVLPSGTPLFAETNIYPGQTFTQLVVAENNSSQDGSFAFRVADLAQQSQEVGVKLSDMLIVEVRENAVDGSIVYGPETLTNLASLIDLILLSPIDAQTSKNYYFTVTFDVDASNEYQNAESIFDLNFAFDLVPLPDNPSPIPDDSDDSTTKDISGATTTDDCTATPPTSAPVLSFLESDTSDGAITLQWTSVSPVTTYAVIFGVESGVYLYGNNNVGNSTSYTVTGLTSGYQYFFQVFGINDCAPGPRSKEVSTPGAIFAGGLVPAPEGFVPGVFGQATESAQLEEGQAQIAGASQAGQCSRWIFWLPAILLVIQALAILGFDWRSRAIKGWSKHGLAFAITILSIAGHYWLRECQCYQGQWLSWLCQWYWLAAIGLTALLQSLNYSLIEID